MTNEHMAQWDGSMAMVPMIGRFMIFHLYIPLETREKALMA